ncbi:MAG TPA: response regulator [Roseiflexaceae bacterium]|nr:response regulator [Roseiflexaceae bacterium]
MTTQPLADSAPARLTPLPMAEAAPEAARAEHAATAPAAESHAPSGSVLWSERLLAAPVLPAGGLCPQVLTPTPQGQPILVIDDHPDIRDLLDQALTDEGYRVVTCADGSVAIDQIVQGKPGLVLLDLMMPRMSGWQIMEALRERSDCGDVKVVLISASRELPRTARELGVECLAKPFNLIDLLNLVERLAGPPPQPQPSA